MEKEEDDAKPKEKKGSNDRDQLRNPLGSPHTSSSATGRGVGIERKRVVAKDVESAEPLERSHLPAGKELVVAEEGTVEKT
jgi:hypothetical protein